MLDAFLYGVLLAFGLIIPLGPQNLFVLSQGTHERKFRQALPTIITAGICDTMLITIAALGLSLVILKIKILKTIILIIGICFLVYVGWILWRKAKKESVQLQSYTHLTLKQQILFTASFSILNPHAILDTVAVIGTNALIYQGAAKLAFTLACISVSWIWFFSLAAFGKALSRIPNIGFYQNRISAIIMWIVAINLIFKLFHT